MRINVRLDDRLTWKIAYREHGTGLGLSDVVRALVEP